MPILMMVVMKEERKRKRTMIGIEEEDSASALWFTNEGKGEVGVTQGRREK